MLIPGGPFTLFAPVDLAFDALPPGYLNNNFLDLEHSRRKYILLSKIFQPGTDFVLILQTEIYYLTNTQSSHIKCEDRDRFI